MRLKTLIVLLLTAFIPGYAQRLVVDCGSLIVHTRYQKDQGIYYDLISTGKGITTYQAKIFETPFNRVVLRAQIGISYRANFGKRYFYQAGMFTGENCLHGAIVGIRAATGWEWKHLSIGAMAGGYFQDRKPWHEKGFKAHSFIPLCGIMVSFKKEFDTWGIELCNNLTPLMTIHNFSIIYKL